MWRAPQLCPYVVSDVGNRIQSRDTVYATGIPNYLRDSEKVAEIFSRAGKIRRDFRGQMRIKMYNRRDGSFNGRARITYETDKEAFLACHLIDRERHGENVLEVKMALDFFRNQKNEPNLENSDWSCNLCDKRGLRRVNYVWQTTCYNCQNDKTFCDTIGKTEKSNVKRQMKEESNNKKAIRLEKKFDLDSNKSFLNPFFLPESEIKVEGEIVNKPAVSKESGIYISSDSDDDDDDSTESSSDTEKVEHHLNENIKYLWQKKILELEGTSMNAKPKINEGSSIVVKNVHNISSSETDNSMDMDINTNHSHEGPIHTPVDSKFAPDQEDSTKNSFVPNNERENLDTSCLKNELELDIGTALLNIFLKHDRLKAVFPLDIKIDVSQAVKRHSLDDKKLNVDLDIDESLFSSSTHDETVISGMAVNFSVGEDGQKQEKTLDSITLEDDQGTATFHPLEKSTPSRSSVKIASEKQARAMDNVGVMSSSENDSDDDDDLDKPVHSYVQTPKETNHGEDEKSRKKFTLDQDKVILDKIVANIIPGQRLDYLEIVVASSSCKEVANRLSRTESSIQGRWKYSLRTWLLEHFRKKTQSWTGFKVKASIERRKAVVDYFVKELRKRDIKIDGSTANKIQRSNYFHNDKQQ